MIKSMTGYATAEKIADEITVSAEMRAYNNRHLDIVLRMPPSYMVLEDKVKKIGRRYFPLAIGKI
ncbi:YicC/YloC family endoribonuclease, partial [Thermodesulfobacteriota bacterium]